MAKTFTIYWTPSGWSGLAEGKPIERAFGSGFVGKIHLGDKVFIMNVKDGLLRLLGSFMVADVGYVEDLPPEAVTWDAPEFLVASHEQFAPLKIREVPTDLVGRLRFLSKGKAEGTVATNPDGGVNGQAVRATRELSTDSAALLDGLLGKEADAGWSSEELEASVKAYFEMAARTQRGEQIVKARIYRQLAQQFGRSESAFEYRLQNISYVLSLMGRQWLKGLAPAKNVGIHIAATIEKIIGQLEGNVYAASASEHLNMTRFRGRSIEKPTGSVSPSTFISAKKSFVRDAQVKAWVLDRADGVCEACGLKAPFRDADDLPFLEVHHVVHLADKGKDTPQNAIAVCPNCHRRLHYSNDSLEYRESLYGRVRGLVR